MRVGVSSGCPAAFSALAAAAAALTGAVTTPTAAPAAACCCGRTCAADSASSRAHRHAAAPAMAATRRRRRAGALAAAAAAAAAGLRLLLGVRRGVASIMLVCHSCVRWVGGEAGGKEGSGNVGRYLAKSTRGTETQSTLDEVGRADGGATAGAVAAAAAAATATHAVPRRLLACSLRALFAFSPVHSKECIMHDVNDLCPVLFTSWTAYHSVPGLPMRMPGVLPATSSLGLLVLVAAAAARRRHQAGKDAARLRQLACSVRMQHPESSL